MRSIQVSHLAVILAIVCQPALWSSEPALEEAARRGWESGRMLTLVVEQNGRLVVASDGETIPLERAPFTIWVVYLTPENILMQVSNESIVYDAMGMGGALVEMLGSDAGQIMGLAESSYNLDRTIYVDTFGSHYLANPRFSAEHRHNRVYLGTVGGAFPGLQEFTAGGRDVEFIRDQSRQTSREYHLAEMPYKELFITAFVSVYDKEYLPVVLDFRKVRLAFVE